jgi:ABC-2 type transport system ATP-binding protein
MWKDNKTSLTISPGNCKNEARPDAGLGDPRIPLLTPTGMLLRTEHLTKDYGRSRALDDLHLSVAAGEVFGLLGPNGSGKTTALRLLLGFLRPTAGHAWIDGHECWRDSVAVRRRVAYLPSELRLYENMSGRQLVRFLCRLRGQPVNAELDELARCFDIDLERPLAQLSSGMKRKVALLQVLAPHAALLIMDEPTNALDPTMRDELLNQVRRARQRGQTVLFSSHVLSEVEAVCDRVAILQRGRLVHLQDLSKLREGRLFHVRFTGPPEPLPPLDGLLVHTQHGDEITLEYTGPLAELLGWLGRQPLADLRMESLGLKGIYHRYHGSEPAAADPQGRSEET